MSVSAQQATGETNGSRLHTHMIVVVVVVVAGTSAPFSGAAVIGPLLASPLAALAVYAGAALSADVSFPVVIAVAMDGSIFWSTTVGTAVSLLVTALMLSAGTRCSGLVTSVSRELSGLARMGGE